MSLSKSKVDKAGIALAKDQSQSIEELIELEDIFDQYRKAHLQPLSETTLELQEWLRGYNADYYIAQRLKRKPQIIRKLNRLSVRLTQLQDIGGCRIIVERNSDVDQLLAFLQEKVKKQSNLSISRATDYRPAGRDDTGYRALHVLLSRSGFKLELQIRSRIQHYWAESIERTSVIYGYHLKEGEGDTSVIKYFKNLSGAFYEIEAGRQPSPQQRVEIDLLRQASERVIEASDRGKVFDSFVNEDIIKVLTEKECRNPAPLNNWIIVFDWNTGAFVSWDIVGRSPDEAIKAYVEYERNFPADQNYEVVLIGSSKVATVRKTHSHYFGINSYEKTLENLDESIIGFSSKMDIDVGSQQILIKLHTKHFWGKKPVAVSTLRNHFCQNVLTFDSSLESLIKKGFIIRESQNGPVSLNVKMRRQIEQYL
ncbi:RelA/SpoT domain-containing protein [Pseudomonas tohonis]|nr:RelA/SpoT domain-containing protein [Pseudomonas tohonis]